VVKSGRHKDLGSPFRKMRPEDRQILQSVMEDVHDQFIEAVADGRSLDATHVRQLADGRIFTGRQAKDANLVDDLGDLADAIRLAGDLSGIEGEPKVVEPKRRFSIRDWLDSRVLSALPNIELRSGVSLKYLMAF
jgi:protease-4